MVNSNCKENAAAIAWEARVWAIHDTRKFWDKAEDKGGCVNGFKILSLSSDGERYAM